MNNANPRYRRRLRGFVDRQVFVVTTSASQVTWVVRDLIEKGVNVLGVNGGDGTLHGVINALYDLLENKEISVEDVPLLLPLNGGTYNIVSRAMGTKGNPVATVREFLRRFDGLQVEDIERVPLPVLEISTSRDLKIRGMVFGSEVVANALELCSRFGSGYLGLLKLLAMGSAGAFFRTGFLEKHGWRLRPSDWRVVVDKRVMEASAVTISTVNLTLVKGLIWSLTASPRTDAFHVRVIKARRPVELAMLIPELLWERSHPLIEDFSEATYVETHGAFTLDGELYPNGGRVVVRPGRWVFELVSFK